MKPYYESSGVTLFHGDCIEVMRALPDESVHAIVTDPPYGLEFMGKAWDRYTPLDFEQWCATWATEALRLLKPGGHLLAFGGSRTWHRLAAGIEDAGFEVRDSIAWLYGSGFPKSLDVSKAIDKAAGAEREVVGRTATPYKVDAAASRGTSLQGSVNGDFSKQADAEGYRYTEHTAPSTPEAAAWQGWGTALKPAFEPIVVARKPLIGTVAVNVLTHGAGALNIDGARVAATADDLALMASRSHPNGTVAGNAGGSVAMQFDKPNPFVPNGAGRWPSKVLLDGSQADELDKQAPDTGGSGKASGPSLTGASSSVARGKFSGVQDTPFYGDSGGASRFFPTFRYEAKAPTSERPTDGLTAHPTVKPLDLMRWLVRLVTPPNGVVLEPFAGSGTTLEAATLEGFDVIGIEREADYLPLIRKRLSKPMQQSLFGDMENIA